MTTAETKSITFGSRNYVIVSVLAILLAIVSTTVIVGLESYRNYLEIKDIALNVTLANVAAAQKVCQQFSLQFALVKILYLAPIVTTLGVLTALLWRRALPARTRRVCPEDWFALFPIPALALAVFFLNPTTPITTPFSSDLWLTQYSPASRAKVVDSLLKTVNYHGMNVSDLRVLLGVPDQQEDLLNKSGRIGYSISETGQRFLYFYFNERHKVIDAKIVDNQTTKEWLGID